MFLKCNNVRCRSDITNLCIITFCSHIFCYTCFPKLKQSKTCLACKIFLNEKDFYLKELNKKPCLIGFTLQEIFNSCQEALLFYINQVKQELCIQQAYREKYEDDLLKFKSEIQSLQANYEIELQNKNQKIERIEALLEKERQSVYDLNNQMMERNREYQKNLSKFDISKNKRVNLKDLSNIK